MTTQEPADLPYPSHFTDVLGPRGHYVCNRSFHDFLASNHRV